MHIALITDGISPYVLGGMQKHSLYLAKYFAKNGIYVDLIHYNDSNYDIQQLEFFTEEEKKFIHSIVLQFPTSFKFPGHYIYNSYRYSQLAYNSIKEQLDKYDFIYTKGFTGWKTLQSKTKKCPIGVNFHGYEMFQIAPSLNVKLQHYLLRPFVKQLARKADFVFSYGGKITPIIQQLNIKASKIIEIPSGVESHFINSSISKNTTGIRRFIFMGRAERRKGIVELNHVLEKLIQQQISFQFDFIGPIHSAQQIHHSSITYHGEIRDTEKLKSILRQCDVLVCPSWSEGFPNVIIEAMASGLAIIATNVGAVSEVVSNKNGWLIEAAKSEQLEKSMKEAISLPDLTSKKEHSLHLINTEYNWDIIAQKTIQQIQKITKA